MHFIVQPKEKRLKSIRFEKSASMYGAESSLIFMKFNNFLEVLWELVS